MIAQPGGGPLNLKSFSPTFVIRVYDRLRTSFWFLPTIAIALSVPAAATVVHFDHFLTLNKVPLLGWTETTPVAARTMLSTVVGALITVTGVTLSLMMLVLSQTATALGPRIVRTIVSGNELQLTLAAFMATTAFCLTTLRSIREPEAIAFVPEIAVVMSTMSFFGAVAALMYFVNHVSQIIRVPKLLARLAADLRESIEENLPDGAVPPDLAPVPPPARAVRNVVCSETEGYVQGLNLAEIVRLAAECDGFARVLVRVGQFVTDRTDVVLIESDTGLSDEQRAAVLDAVAVGDHRTPRQDVECTILEIAEIGVRALSPGINDPRTASMCLQRLAAGLGVIASRPTPLTELFDDDGRPRLVRPPIDFERLLLSAFRDITFYSAGNLGVLLNVVDALRHVSGHCLDDVRRRIVAQTAASLTEEIRRQPEVRDRSRDPHYEAVLQDLTEI